MPIRPSLLLVCALAGCWRLDRPALPDGPEPWLPIEAAPDGWEILSFTLDVACPDGEPAPLLVVRPRDDATPRPIAVVLHDGAFDYVPTPPDGPDPLDAAHWRSPPRLRADWAARRAAAVLGTWAPPDADGPSTGALAVAFAERGVAVAVPGGCFGDLASGRGTVQATDGFAREGAAVVLAAWSAAGSAEAPLGFSASERYLVGLGDSGRGVGPLLRAPGVPAPSGLLLDSVPDDLGYYYDDPATWGEVVVGLDRIWPAGRSAALADAVRTAPWPARAALVWSSEDPQVPRPTVDPLVAAAAARGATVIDTAEVRHLQTLADPEVARAAVVALLGEPPAEDTD